MAIPTMLHSSGSSIPEVCGASALSYLAGEALNSSTEEVHESIMESLTEEMEDVNETRSATAQTQGEQYVKRCSSSAKQPQLYSSSAESSGLIRRLTCHGTHHKSHQDQRKRRKKRAGVGQSRWRDRTRKKSLSIEEYPANSLGFPVLENHHCPQIFSRLRHQTIAGLLPRPEVRSWAQGATTAPDFTRPSSVAGLGLNGVKAVCCSDIYSSRGHSGCPELDSDSETAYIYAESIKGGDSSLGFSQDCDSVCLYTKVVEKQYVATSEPVSAWHGGYQMKGFDSDLDMETLCLYREEKSSSDSLIWSTASVLGSDLYRGGDSTCVYANWEKSFDSCKVEASSDSSHWLVRPQWSFDCSDFSCDTDDRESEPSYCSLDQQSSSDSDSHLEFGYCDSPFSHFEEDSCDLYNASTHSSDGTCCGKENEVGLDVCCCEDHSEQNRSKSRGVITQVDRGNFSLIFREMVKEAAQDRDLEKVNVSEGFLFHPQKAKNSEYREGREYSILRHIQNGSYGDVFSVRDKGTGFTCAAKRIPLCSFSWEEVGTWSKLDSARVLQLFGAVREGLNIVLFMDLKTGSLAQLLKGRGSLSEDLALYYHWQVLQALEHLHSRRVIHLDVKVDNVLLSKDGRESFLCDFGLSERLDQTGHSTKTFRGSGLRGTESHMSPEVARGERCSDRADVWSSCCMLLHMLSGHQPWTRYYTHPLCLKIVSEPAPLWEIPAGCDPLTCEVIRGGLVKYPEQRDSAKELLKKTTRALRALGSLPDVGSPTASSLPDSPETENSPPISSEEIPPLISTSNLETPPPITTASNEEELSAPRIQWVSTWREKAMNEEGTDSEARGSDEESEWETEGEIEEEKRETSRTWMERYWRTREGLEIRRNKQQRPIEEEREYSRGREHYEDIYTESNKTLEVPDDQQEDERERPDMTTVGRRNGNNGLDHSSGVLVEEGHDGGELRHLNDESERESDEDDAEEEDESDLESLRELGSDWAEEEWEPFQRLQILFGTNPQCHTYSGSEDDYSETEEESVTSVSHCEKKIDLTELNSKITLTCHRSTCASEPEPPDKDSDWSDDVSSGVFSSYSSHTDGQSFNVDWSVSTNQPPSCCFEGLGVDIWIEDVSGETLRIRERLNVKLGHVAVGISAQISTKTFCLATLDGKLVSPDMEVQESGMWLQCVTAPDDSTSWDWRVRDGKLEMQENNGLESDTCSTLAV